MAWLVQAKDLAADEPDKFQQYCDQNFDFRLRHPWDFLVLFSPFQGEPSKSRDLSNVLNLLMGIAQTPQLRQAAAGTKKARNACAHASGNSLECNDIRMYVEHIRDLIEQLGQTSDAAKECLMRQQQERRENSELLGELFKHLEQTLSLEESESASEIRVRSASEQALEISVPLIRNTC